MIKWLNLHNLDFVSQAEQKEDNADQFTMHNTSFKSMACADIS
jgi:hypothetical protein